MNVVFIGDISGGYGRKLNINIKDSVLFFLDRFSFSFKITVESVDLFQDRLSVDVVVSTIFLRKIVNWRPLKMNFSDKMQTRHVLLSVVLQHGLSFR